MEPAIFRKINGKMYAEVKTLFILFVIISLLLTLSRLSIRRRINRILGACVFEVQCIRTENCSLRMNFRIGMVLLACVCVARCLVHSFGLYCVWALLVALSLLFATPCLHAMDLFSMENDRTYAVLYRFV